MKIVRSIVAIAAGLLVAVLLVGAIEAIGHLIYPPPPDTDLSDPEQMRSIISKLPTGAIVAVLVAWACGSLSGALVAALIAGRKPWVHAFIVGGLLMAAGIVTMAVIPHPAWFVVAAHVTFVVFTSLGAWLAQRIRKPSAPPGAKPYDMREKNMAC